MIKNFSCFLDRIEVFNAGAYELHWRTTAAHKEGKNPLVLPCVIPMESSADQAQISGFIWVFLGWCQSFPHKKGLAIIVTQHTGELYLYCNKKFTILALIGVKVSINVSLIVFLIQIISIFPMLALRISACR
jgi:hypothetical protein